MKNIDKSLKNQIKNSAGGDMMKMVGEYNQSEEMFPEKRNKADNIKDAYSRSKSGENINKDVKPLKRMKGAEGRS